MNIKRIKRVAMQSMYGDKYRTRINDIPLSIPEAKNFDNGNELVKWLLIDLPFSLNTWIVK